MTREDGQKTAQSGPTSLLGADTRVLLHQLTARILPHLPRLHIFSLEGQKGLEEGPNGPDDQGDSRWLSQLARKRRDHHPTDGASGPSASYLSVSLIEPRAFIFAKCSRRPRQGSGEWPPAAGAGRREFMWHPVSSPFRPACARNGRLDLMGASGRAREWEPRRHEGIQLEHEAP